MDFLSVFAFIFLCALIVWAPGYAQKHREQEICERMKALREADAAAAMAVLDTVTSQTQGEAESINRLNRGRGH